MITPSLPRPLIFAAAAMLAAHAAAQTTPPPAFDPVIALEQAVQLADIQNDPAGAKAFLEKLTGPEIPANIREQAKARLAKLNPTIELNLGPGVKAFEGTVDSKTGKVTVTKTEPPGQENSIAPTFTILGQVKRQGKYPMVKEMTLADAIQAAGGLSDFANGTQLEVVRSAGEKKDSQMLDLAKDGAKPLKAGDILRVPHRLSATLAAERLEEAMNLLVFAGAKDRSALVDAAIDGMAKSMGRSGEFTSAVSEKRVAQLLTDSTAGIGALVATDARGLVIKQAMPGSAAEKAGIKNDSLLVEIDGKTPFALGGDLDSTIAAIRGAAGTRVKLKLQDPSGEVREIEVERVKIEPLLSSCDQIKSDLLPADVLAIAIHRLTPQTLGEVTAILDAQTSQQNPAKGLIINLRGNGGGSLDAAKSIADLFLTEGVILKSKKPSGIETTTATPDQKFAGVPIAVLVDETTAHGAEITAAALQDHHRATIIGRRTAGAGAVATVQRLKGGGLLKYPVSWFLRATGSELERHANMTESDTWGVVPDIKVAGQGGNPLKKRALSPEDSDLNLMIKAALAHFDSLNAKK